ncbi:MAG: flagellar hook-length control protein FliK [Phycisphaerales bacterium]
MTHAISNAASTQSKQFLTPNAQALPTPTRTFDLVLGDAVFGESIDERPEPVEAPKETKESDETDDAEREDAVEDDRHATDATDAKADTPAANPNQDTEKINADDQIEFVQVREARPTGGVRALREGNVSARGIRAEITHAASVDVASINAQELASRGTKARTPEPNAEPFRPNVGGESVGKDAKPARADSGSTTPAGTNSPAAAEAKPAPTNTAPAGQPAPATPDAAGVSTQSVAASSNTAAAKPATGQAPAVAGVSASVAATAQQARATSTVAVRGAEGGKQPGVQTKATFRETPTNQRGGAERPALATLQRGLASVLKAGGGTVTLKLTPEALGQVKVELNLKNGVANAKFEAATESARRLLTENMSTLREALEAKGVRVERMSVEMRSAETPPEAARGERPGTDAGRAHQGQQHADNTRDAGSETGSDGRTAEDHAQRQHDRPRSGQPDAERPAHTDEHAEPGAEEQARTPAASDTRLGLDTIA